MRKESIEDWIISEPYWRDAFRYCTYNIKKFSAIALHVRRLTTTNTISWNGNQRGKQASFRNRAHNRYSCTFETRTVYDTISFYKEY